MARWTLRCTGFSFNLPGKRGGTWGLRVGEFIFICMMMGNTCPFAPIDIQPIQISTQRPVPVLSAANTVVILRSRVRIRTGRYLGVCQRRVQMRWRAL